MKKKNKNTRCQNTGITRDASGFSSSSSRLNRNFALPGTGLVYFHCRKISLRYKKQDAHIVADETGAFDLKGQITSLENIRGSITLKPLSSRIFIISSQGKTQSVSENAISPPCNCTVQVPPFILFTASKGIIFFLKTSYLNLN